MPVVHPCLSRSSFGGSEVRSEVLPASCSPTNEGNRPGGEGDESDVAANIRRLLEGQRRLERLLLSVVSEEQEQSCSRGGRRQQYTGDFTNEMSHRSFTERAASMTSSTLIAVPQVRDGWLGGTDDDLKRACEVESASLVENEARVSEDDVPLGGTASSFLVSGFRRVLSIGKRPRLDGASALISINGGRLAEKPFLVWSPESRVRFIMDTVSVLVLVYDVFSLPYLLAFEVPQKGLVMELSIVSVAFWTLDVLFRFRTGFWQKGRLEMNPREVARQYLRSTFAMDASLVVLDLVSIVFSYLEDNHASEMEALKLWRIGKVSRIVRCLGFLRLRSVSDIVERVSQRSKILQATSMVIYDVVRLIFVIMWLNHIIACIWVVIGRSVSSDTGLHWLDLPMSVLDYSSYNSAGDRYQYTTALHWSLTQMTPGSMQVFPVNSSERVFNIVGLVFGVLVFSTLISSISSTVTQFKIGIASNTCKLDQVNRFLRRAGINPSLAIQVRKQVRDKMKYQKPLAYQDVEAFTLLPLSLRASLELELCRPHLDLNPYFHFVLAVDAITAEELCHSCATFSVLGKNDTLFLAGVEATGIFFVTNGTLGYIRGVHTPISSRYTSRNLTMMTSRLSGGELEGLELVEPGHWLSEAALWCDWQHVGTAEVSKASSCEVLRIPADNLIKFMRGRRGAVGQMSWAYARSFHALLSAALRHQTHTSETPTDLHLPFTTDEVMYNLPAGARAYVGFVALRELRTLLRSFRGMAQGWVSATLSDGWPDVDRLRDDVERGTSALVLSRGSRFGVQRVITLVELQLRREDEQVLVALQRPHARGDELAETRLPGLRQEEGEYPEQCYQRLLDDYFGDMASSIVLDGAERQHYETMEEDYGVYTRCIKVVFNARWEPVTITDSTGPVPLEIEGDPLQTDEVIHLPSGGIVAWITPEELQRCIAVDGSKSLGQWLLDWSSPLAPFRKRSKRLPTIGSKASEAVEATL